MSDKETLGQVILCARKEKGLTQRQLAKIVGVANSTINRIEMDDPIKPVPATLRGIADALNLDYNYLLALNGQVADQPEIRVIQRASRNMSQADLNKMMAVLNVCFDNAFTDGRAGSDTNYNNLPNKEGPESKDTRNKG